MRLMLTSLLLLSLFARPARADESPYKLVPDFPQLPPGLKLGAASGVATDRAGNVLVFHRGDAQKPVLVFDRSGAFLRSFGGGLFSSTHGLRVDPDGNVWATDSANHTVVKFSLDGKVLLTLGERDVPGDDAKHFNRPTDVAFAKNGDFYVSDGYGNSRVVQFDKAGRFLRAWGTMGDQEGQFNLPHAVQLDSEGFCFVARARFPSTPLRQLAHLPHFLTAAADRSTSASTKTRLTVALVPLNPRRSTRSSDSSFTRRAIAPPD